MSGLPSLFSWNVSPTHLFIRDFLNDWSTALASPLSNLKSLHYPIDIYQDADSLNFEYAVIGGDKKDITVSITDDKYLLIKYQKNEENPKTSERNYLYNRLTKRNFNFEYQLPEGMFDTDTVETTYKDGLLKVRIPFLKKTEKKPKVKNVSIN